MLRGRCEILGYLIVRIGDWRVPARMDFEGQVGHRGDCPCVAITLAPCVIASRTAGTSSRTHEQATWGWGGASNCGQHDEAGENQRLHPLPRTARAHVGPPRVSGASMHIFGAFATLRRPARPPRDTALRAASSPGLSPRPNQVSEARSRPEISLDIKIRSTLTFRQKGFSRRRANPSEEPGKEKMKIKSAFLAQGP